MNSILKRFRGLSPDSEKVNKHRLCRKMISIFGLICMLFGPFSCTLCFAEGDDADGYAVRAIGSKGFELIILSSYQESMKIGDSKIIIAASTSGSEIKWKSSDSRVASVDIYGVVTAKKAGTCKISAKTSGAEASCTVLVEATKLTLNTRTVSMENGAKFQMSCRTSTGHAVTWKSSKKSVAIISDYGLIQAQKPGTSIITASCDGYKETCTVTVKKPTLSLSADSIKMYRLNSTRLYAKVSSGRPVTWKSSRPSVVSIDENGNITAVKHGEARVSATVDSVIRYCDVKVLSPTITLNKKSITIKKKKTFELKADVSSGIKPTYTSSSTRVATVSADGVIKAKACGNCTISVKEDGTVAKCKVKVTDK